MKPGETNITITLSKVFKRFDEVSALEDINVVFEAGTLTTLLGPSGCGKTTLLRIVSGLETVSGGEILFGNENVTDLSATRRDVGMVFQSYALFPHMTVEQNVGYGLGVLKTPQEKIKEQVTVVLDMVNLAGYQARYPDELSGGQQQRVAVARALILEPKVLLFDEPLSNIDSKLRRSMREEIRHLQQSTGITSIYVTHDQSEALAVSDEVVVMKDGRILQKGPPRSLYHRPESAFVANFIGESNVVEALLVNGTDGNRVELGGIDLALPDSMHIPAKPGMVKLSLRPEVLHIEAKSDDKDSECLEGIVTESAYMGPIIEYSVKTTIGDLFTRGPAYETQHLKGEQVRVRIRPDEIIVIPACSE
ncbi:MAG: ABC transporter ATP-binding protein [Desulfobacterales bacterium]|nr:ABC transporter ATP-binding protein [Desulfobacterales bacterium]